VSVGILLADDHRIIRDGLRSLLEKEPGFSIVGEAENGREAVRKALELKPDLVVMDIAMPDLNGIEATRRILSAQPKIKIVVLSMHAERRFVIEMLKAGAAAYLLKDNAFEELALAIHTVLGDRTYLNPLIADQVIGDYILQLQKNDCSVFSLLTTREREVLQLLAEGMSMVQIAAHLHLSVKTIETHRQNLMEKLEIRSIAELTKYAIREGLTSL
jgi:DNA-binding NarL/FixJ family response regulator